MKKYMIEKETLMFYLYRKLTNIICDNFSFLQSDLY